MWSPALPRWWHISLLPYQVHGMLNLVRRASNCKFLLRHVLRSVAIQLNMSAGHLADCTNVLAS